ncbi:MAG: TerC family protein [Kineosporiaceae bacterium]
MPLETIGTPWLWTATIGAVVALLALDFALTRRPHAVSLREAALWSAFYIALPLAFGVFVLSRYGTTTGVEYYTGYLVEKSLSVDNLFVFILLLTSFAVPRELQQRALLFGIIGALVLRSIFIAVGAAAIQQLSFAFLVFGLVLAVTGVQLLREALSGHEKEVDVDNMRTVRFLRRFAPIAGRYHGTSLLIRENGVRTLTPFAVVIVVIFITDLIFAIDSVPAVYGITGDPYLVFATNAFALLGLRALYFLLEGALSRLIHLSFGLAFILFFIGAKLVLHWAHDEFPGVPEIPTSWSLVVIVLTLATVTVTSLVATRASAARARQAETADVHGPTADVHGPTARADGPPPAGTGEARGTPAAVGEDGTIPR